MGNPKTSMNHANVLLVPGFMSPAWMLWPLKKFLQRADDDRNQSRVESWDYPRVLSDLDVTVAELAEMLESYRGSRVVLVAHSFGDWIARSAINRVSGPMPTALISVCPVVTSVPTAEWLSGVTGDRVPEIAIIADRERSEMPIAANNSILRSFVWAKGEFVVRRPNSSSLAANSRAQFRQREVMATHNSILFPPNGWSAIAEEVRWAIDTKR